MSSYLTFYVKEKDSEGNWRKPIPIVSFSRGSEIYGAFKENGAPYIGDGEEFVYGEVTKDMVREAKSSIEETISDIKKNIDIIKGNLPETASERLELLSSIREMDDTMDELVKTKHYIDFINTICTDLEIYENEAVLMCNID